MLAALESQRGSAAGSASFLGPPDRGLKRVKTTELDQAQVNMLKRLKA